MKALNIYFLFFFVFITSCREENSTLQDLNITPPVENTTTRPTRVKLKATNNYQGNSIVTKTEQLFYYTTDNKLDRAVLPFYFPHQVGLKITYGSNGKISKTESEYYARSFEFFYDVNNRLSTIKEVTEFGTYNGRISSLTYSNGGNEVHVITPYLNTNGNLYDEEIYTFENGNLINYKLYYTSVSNTNTYSNLIHEFRFTYYSTINTLRDILDDELRYARAFFLAGKVLPSHLATYSEDARYSRMALMSKNNVKTIEMRSSPTSQFDITDSFQYEFDHLNRVSKIRDKWFDEDYIIDDYEITY